ncbi:MAG: oxalate decarboxylase [Paenibacillus sp.]|jgi:hypothetical protein|nr:oxalate decarboxylase [Paenibacillus sp.]
MENRPGTQAANGNIPQPIRNDGAGATDFGPRDIMRDIENANRTECMVQIYVRYIFV